MPLLSTTDNLLFLKSSACKRRVEAEVTAREDFYAFELRCIIAWTRMESCSCLKLSRYFFKLTSPHDGRMSLHLHQILSNATCMLDMSGKMVILKHSLHRHLFQLDFTFQLCSLKLVNQKSWQQVIENPLQTSWVQGCHSISFSKFPDFSLTFPDFRPFSRPFVRPIFIRQQFENFVQIFMHADLIFNEKSQTINIRNGMFLILLAIYGK